MYSVAMLFKEQGDSCPLHCSSQQGGRVIPFSDTLIRALLYFPHITEKSQQLKLSFALKMHIEFL
jgi:hypothetical protein